MGGAETRPTISLAPASVASAGLRGANGLCPPAGVVAVVCPILAIAALPPDVM